jgi:hypothetical protein
LHARPQGEKASAAKAGGEAKKGGGDGVRSAGVRMRWCLA